MLPPLESTPRWASRRLLMENAKTGHFVWHDHLAKDPKAAIAFYTEVVGWRTQAFGDGGHYTMWVGSQGPMGGVMQLPDEAVKMGAPPHWTGNVQVADVDATVQLTKKLGGKVYKEPSDIPTVGRFRVTPARQGATTTEFRPTAAIQVLEATKEGEVRCN